MGVSPWGLARTLLWAKIPSSGWRKLRMRPAGVLDSLFQAWCGRSSLVLSAGESWVEEGASS